MVTKNIIHCPNKNNNVVIDHASETAITRFLSMALIKYTCIVDFL